MNKKEIIEISVFLVLTLLVSIVIASPDIWEYGEGGDKSLIGHWKLDGNALDETSYDNDGTVIGVVVTNKGKYGQAYEFDGNDYINFGDLSAFDFNGSQSFTISAWINPQLTANDDPIIVKHHYNNDEGFLFQVYYTGSLWLLLGGGTYKAQSSTGIFAFDNTWHHVVTVIEPNKLIKLYVDGSEPTYAVQDNVTGSVGIPDGLDLLIGKRSEIGRYYEGVIDEVRIYNRTLSAGEVRELYNESKVSHQFKLTGAPELSLDDDVGLVGHWKLNGNALDSSSEGNDGTVTGALVTNKGKFKQAYEFDGVNDIINFGDVDEVGNLTAITISAWIKPTGDLTAKNYKIVSKRPETGGFYTDVFGGRLRWQTFNMSDVLSPHTSAGSVITEEWSYVVFVWNGTMKFIYINGIQDVTTDAFTGEMGNSSYSLYIATYTGTDYEFVGSIDEVRIYNRSLSADEIRTLYNESIISHKLIIKGSADQTGFSSDNIKQEFMDDDGGRESYEMLVAASEDVTKELTIEGTPIYMSIMAQEFNDFGGTLADNLVTINGVNRFNITDGDFPASTGADVFAWVDYPVEVGWFVQGINTINISPDDSANEWLRVGIDANNDYDRSTKDGGGAVTGEFMIRVNTTESLVGHWKLNGNALDSSTKGNDGTVTNALVTNKGKFKQAYEFDGVDNYINVSDNSGLDFTSEDFSISIWIKPDIIEVAHILDRGFYQVDGYYIDMRSSSGQLQFVTSQSSQRQLTYSANGVIIANIWQHFVVVRNGATVSFYKDGSEVSYTSQGTHQNPTSNERSLIIGASDIGSLPFDGLIDEVKIYNRSLSASEIRQLYNESVQSNRFVIMGTGDAN